MGCSFSSQPSSTFKNIRVVHLNGYVEDFEQTVTVAQVTGKPPKDFVCTGAQLVSGGLKPLKPDTQLELGHVYFLLPYSTFRSDVSPVDLASVARKLTTIAKASRSRSKSARTNFLSSSHASSPIWSSPARSPNRVSDGFSTVEPGSGVVAYGLLKSSKASYSKFEKPDIDMDMDMDMD
ncbi:hypothetical protein F0562_009134 [Nyssa sinensis]|uniref:DUF4228 domain-containing protein n=1 Tax=Nyssa sinensis TaxID=561372 RepID=A0A5J4ZXR4_9ASTE|nr:hypothetical protein F0562_009134 [Nyssa sinensis]